jgi:diguanylate cyclase (GGDEF)-like protein/PAS domain S-box-containing protein
MSNEAETTSGPAEGSEKLRVLCLEDSPVDAELVRESLSGAGMRVDMNVAPDRSAFECLLADGPYDVILADFALPGFDALGALELASAACPTTPFICVSGAIGEEVTAELLRNGADDVVLKDRLARLPFAVENAIDERAHERALRESEERFRIFAEFTYDWETWLGPDGSYVYVSPSCERITGHAASEFMADAGLALRIVHPDDRPLVAEHLQAACLAEHQAQLSEEDLEYRILTPDGQTRWISHLCHSVFNEDGDWLGRRASNRDVTEIKESEHALLESQRSLRAILHATADGILAVAADGKILFASDRFAELWRIPAAVLETRDDDALLERVLDQLADPTAFLAKVGELNGSDKESLDVIDFEDGRVFERFSLPLQRGDGISGRVWSFRDVTDARQAEAKLREQATVDQLTGTMNRRRFFEVAESEFKRAARHHESIAVAMIDIDRFKQINDTLGHSAGDRTLTAVADICRQHVREVDVFARLGGDEFAVLMPLTSREQGRTVAERVRIAIHDTLGTGADESVPVTVSVGLAASPDGEATVESLMKLADEALYEAKHEGRNRTVASTIGME